jgi:hypothetical protein
MDIPTSQFRWLSVFALTLGVLTGLAAWAQLRLPSFREPPFDFSTMSPNQLLVVDGLTRRQEGSIKLGYAEAFEAPAIGLYGNHVFRYFSSDAFGHPGDVSYFFNYWFANLALPEIYRYLLHIERLGRLPKELILVQITSPNMDNGSFIINFGYELPPDLLLIRSVGDGLLVSMVRAASFVWQVVENWLHETLNYNTFILSFAQRGYKERVVDPRVCHTTSGDSVLPVFLRFAPASVRDFFLQSTQQYCHGANWWAAFRRDGSNDPHYSGKKLIKNEDPLRDSERGLTAGDEYYIANQMQAIAAIGRRHNIRVVFVVPPAFESNRDDSIVNQIFNKALAMASDLTVVDDRSMRNDPTFFADYLHPSPKYFESLVTELRLRGLAQP